VSRPTISVLIAVYNGEPFIQRSLDSVYAQTRPPEEILVVDDGSADHTPSILRANEPRIRVISQANGGRSLARNVGLRAAQGDYVAFLDADDEYLPLHLEQLAACAAETEAELVSDVIGLPYFGEHDRLPGRFGARNGRRHLANCRLWIQNSMVKRQWVLDQRVQFDSEWSIAEDVLFFWECILMGARIGFVRRVGTRIGIHDANTTADPFLTLATTLRAYDHLEKFAQERGVARSAALRRAIAKGRRHKEVSMLLLAFFTHAQAPGTRVAPQLLAFAFSLQPTRLLERLRCLLAIAWRLFPPLRVRAFERAVFGFWIFRLDTRR
jgi:glycosyltransferase involved in cell wall biosynthesis